MFPYQIIVVICSKCQEVAPWFSLNLHIQFSPFLNTTEKISPLLSLESPLTVYSRKLWIQTLHLWIVKGNSKLNLSVSIIFCLSAFLEVLDFFSHFYVRGQPFNSCGEGGWVILEKISCKRLSEEKNCMQHKCNRKLMGKKGQQISCPPDCYRKKILDDQKSPTPPSPSRVKWSAPKWRA